MNGVRFGAHSLQGSLKFCVPGIQRIHATLFCFVFAFCKLKLLMCDRFRSGLARTLSASVWAPESTPSIEHLLSSLPLFPRSGCLAELLLGSACVNVMHELLQSNLRLLLLSLMLPIATQRVLLSWSELVV